MMKDFYTCIVAVLWIIRWIFALFAFVCLGVIVVAAGSLLGFTAPAQAIGLGGHDLVKEVVIPGIAFVLICGVIFKLFGFFMKGVERAEKKYEAKEKEKEEEEHARLMAYQSLRHGSGYGGGAFTSAPLTSHDHNELDAVARAIEITRSYGMDWTGYDAEASGPSPDAYSPPGYDPEAYTGDIW